eukprot:CAMPEP_0201194216 /NCGR_PEP_ID=MMETSP0851-20130426/148680_1 /ASSEMBLY_ACC=CAM_ASM_000631 /TAXON_ID=183588 /ORGANISM="Pseudo-nitzschia fraudulenta, Strain WWA7" /LENGTH=130 /DNA_ID=CAMNT_0047480851 /DNA_START=63 /DNA_END=452 /DNA_ORIENTATION=+
MHTVRYSFQWYRSSSRKKSNRRDNFPISPSKLYTADNNFDNDSIGDSTFTSKRTYSSGGSVSSSGSSWSSSSSSISCSSYSMSTAGVTHHTISVASVTSDTNTVTTKNTKEHQLDNAWVPLEGATGASFQ